MAWARHGKCELDTATLCKSNGKDTFQTLRGTAWQGNGMGAACYVWIGLYGWCKNVETTDGFCFTIMLEHTGRFVQGFLSKEQCDNTEESPILYWSGSSWTLPVTSTEISTEMTIVCDVTDTIKNATEELKRISQNGLEECFQHIYSRWQKCTVAYGGCSEGSVA